MNKVISFGFLRGDPYKTSRENSLKQEMTLEVRKIIVTKPLGRAVQNLQC